VPRARGKKTRRDYAVFPDGYWARPVIDPQVMGDASPTPIFCAVGAALSAWEGVEEALATLLLTLSQCREAAAANAVRRIFGAIESSSGRLAAIGAAAEMYFGQFWERDEIKWRFEALIEHAVKPASYRRNDIAHGRMTSATIQDGLGSVSSWGL
jgi:hypothetical protein